MSPVKSDPVYEILSRLASGALTASALPRELRAYVDTLSSKEKEEWKTNAPFIARRIQSAGEALQQELVVLASQL